MHFEYVVENIARVLTNVLFYVKYFLKGVVVASPMNKFVGFCYHSSLMIDKNKRYGDKCPICGGPIRVKAFVECCFEFTDDEVELLTDIDNLYFQIKCGHAKISHVFCRDCHKSLRLSFDEEGSAIFEEE